MTTVTANEVRVLARSRDVDPVLAVVDDEVVVIPRAEVREQDRVLCTKQMLVHELGNEVSDIEAQLFAGRLTNLLTD
ncbi:hypothetical protein Cs7R123_66670 [Catellatospora sp. TT07R-123]|uniref:hypothetical protein n=1 Tax=Catellatospora sp. TT07R-123 TaxID=2733863 RepID=UPI001B22E696|nr:hypothetical protein [Catellatospora sp. TT07R-123]GHJ49325.1 hypothetical protein Cs7R123_66670 [Catellatospora sp. TT07R-123]